MKVSELIAQLEKLPQDMRVLTPGDDCVDYRDANGVEVAVIRKDVFTKHLNFGKSKQMTAVVIA